MEISCIADFSNWVKSDSLMPWLSWGGVILTVMSTLFGFYFYIKSRRLKQPCCITTSYSIVGPSVARIDGVEIHYKTNPVKSLCVTQLIFWNAGGETIRDTDFPSSAPFQVVAKPEVCIWDASIVFIKNEANCIAAQRSPDGSHVDLHFEYLDKNEGFILDIIHTGTSDMDLNINATFKGAQPLSHARSASFHKWPFPFNKILTSDVRPVIALILAISPFYVYILQYTMWLGFYGRQYYKFSEYVANISLCALSFYGSWYLFKTRLPKDFQFPEFE